MPIKLFFGKKTSLKPRINLKNTMGTALSISRVIKWFTEFCYDHTTTSEAERSGCPLHPE